jgi:3-oxoacyl-[acyl-carrier protein] reductase
MIQERLRLKDKVVIVTGGAQGIGRACALGMADEGAKLVVADINLAAAETTVGEIQGKGKEALALKTDVSSTVDTQAMAKAAVERFGRIDVLVNNAAVFQRTKMAKAPFWELDLSEWDRLIAVNLKGTFLCCRAVFPFMKAQKSGKIINVSSGTFFVGIPNQLHYVASKGGIIGMTRSMARELGDYGINVNCIAPGATQSYDTSEKANFEPRESSLQQLVSRRCLKRIERVEDLVGTAIFLASSDSDFITGQTILVDGGEAMH